MKPTSPLYLKPPPPALAEIQFSHFLLPIIIMFIEIEEMKLFPINNINVGQNYKLFEFCHYTDITRI